MNENQKINQFVYVLLAVHLFCPAAVFSADTNSDSNNPVVYHRPDLVAIEQQRIISQADEFLKQQPITVTASTCPRSKGGKNDFYSEGDYWWPNPKEPNGPYMHRDGMTNPDNFTAHRKAMRRFGIHTATLAAAFKITSDKRYAEHAIKHFRAWFVDPQTRMNPNLQYSQAIKGRCSGRSVGVIDGIHLVEAVRAVSVLEDLSAISDKDLEVIKKWCTEYLSWLTKSDYGVKERDADNNHSTCWLMQAAEYARFLGDEELMNYCRNRFKTVIMPKQLSSDGRFRRELARTKPYGYSLFNLDVMAAVCQILSTQTDNLWKFKLADGRTFKQAVEFMYPFIKDKSKWPFRKDVMYFDIWPARHPTLLFAGLAFGEQKYIELWKKLPAMPKKQEGIRNFPIRQPILWVHDSKFSDWKFESHREEIAAKHYKDNKITYRGRPTLGLAGGGKEFADGKWVSVTDVESNSWYRFTAKYITEDVEQPRRSIMARIIWLDENGRQANYPYTEYPATLHGKTNERWSTIQQSYKSPAKAKQAKVELIYHWDGDGCVNFAGVRLDRVLKPAARIVKLAAIHYRPKRKKTLQQNLERFAELVGQAGEKGADIVCLPEAIVTASTGRNDMNETIPGPTSRFFSSVAKKHKVYIVAGLSERDGPVVYNTAVLFDRQGQIAGKYRKVCLPREEFDQGITPGDSFNVFDTDFGRIGIMICWDVFFPEPARVLALKGAEIIMMPIWGGNMNLAKARAIENQVYLVTSCYNTKTMRTAVFDREGNIMAEGGDQKPVIVVEVDLSQRKIWPWLGDFKNRIPREIAPKKALNLE